MKKTISPQAQANGFAKHRKRSDPYTKTETIFFTARR